MKNKNIIFNPDEVMGPIRFRDYSSSGCLWFIVFWLSAITLITSKLV
jgi:hypothetical protein